MIGKSSKSQEPYKDLGNLTQADIAAYYLNIKSIPSLIHSPLRQDNKPSFALYCPRGTEVNYRDFSTGESGTIWTLLMKMWNCSYREANAKVYNDLGTKSYGTKVCAGNFTTRRYKINSYIDLKCKVRKWRDYDLEYWSSYGISLEWLKYADVYPISHKIIIKDGISYAFGADKYAYAFVEFKDNKTTMKLYQPFNKSGYKWTNSHNKSVLSLWTKIPKTGKKLCICSSLKDALCLWANTNIPAIALQGEGYNISEAAKNALKERYENIYILLDNDAPGLKDAEILAEKTGFKNIILPKFEGGKDISDFFKIKGKQVFISTINKLFNS